MASYFESGRLSNGGPLFTHRAFGEEVETTSVTDKDKGMFYGLKRGIDYYCPSNPSKLVLVAGMYIHSHNFPTLSLFTQKTIEYALDDNLTDAVVYGASVAIYLGVIGLTFAAVSYGNRNRTTFQDLAEALTRG